MTITTVPVPRRSGDDAGRAKHTAELFETACATTDPDARASALNDVIVLNRGVADAVASRYFRRGLPDDDLCQTAYEGLIKATQRFDPELGYDFLSYAVPTIRGEVRRHFRNHGWAVRPPRRLQDLQWRLHQATDQLFQELGREPTRAEIATEVGVPKSELDEALQAYGSFTPLSLDVPRGDSHENLGSLLSSADDQFTRTETRLTLLPLLRELSERDQRIVYLRFCEDQTQAEIGVELGVTQMQVSRLLSRILRTLRAGLERAEGTRHADGEPALSN